MAQVSRRIWGIPARGCSQHIGDQVKPRKHGRDVFVFFDNTEVKLRASVDAHRMAKELGVGVEATVKQTLKELGVKRMTGRG